MKLTKIKKQILAIECGHLSDKGISGGDLILEKMAPYLLNDYKLSVIIPEIGSRHWKHLKKVSLYELQKNFLDKNPNPLMVLISYILRSINTFFLINRVNFEILYSSTNIAADVFPAFFFKITHSKTTWIARIHHLIPPPNKRVGNILINTCAFILQQVTLLMLKSATQIIVLNENSKSDLIKSGFESGKIATLPAGVSISKINKIKSPELIYDAVFVGRMSITKGILDLPRIWLNVSKVKPDANLIIIGEKNKSVLKKLNVQIYDAKLQKSIQILGNVPEQTLYKYLKSSKVFLFTDKEAGFSIATLEAMASGTPVIGYDIGILGSVFKKGYIKVPKNNIPRFSEAVLDVITNPKLRRKLSLEAKNSISTFSWQNASIKFKQILDDQKVKSYNKFPI